MGINISKTKQMTSEKGLNNADSGVVQIEGEMAEHFTYLGSSVASSDCEILVDAKCRIAKASQVFGCLRQPIFSNSVLSVASKRAAHWAKVLTVLLYGAETWTLQATHVRRLTTFHNCRV